MLKCYVPALQNDLQDSQEVVLSEHPVDVDSSFEESSDPESPPGRFQSQL